MGGKDEVLLLLPKKNGKTAHRFKGKKGPSDPKRSSFEENRVRIGIVRILNVGTRVTLSGRQPGGQGQVRLSQELKKILGGKSKKTYFQGNGPLLNLV